MEVENTYWYRFRFKSKGMSDNMAHYVLSHNLDDIRLFLTQHAFNKMDTFIDTVPVDEKDDEREYELKPFMMKSNYSEKVFNVISTEHFMYECAQSCADTISLNLIFNCPHIIDDTIPIMRVISELISKLDHVYVLDHTICDPETGEPYSSQAEKYTKCGYLSATKYGYTADDDEISYDDSSIYESLTNINRDYPMPFTVEMYVSYFANLLTDSYEK